MRDKRDRQKKRFIDALTTHGTVLHAAQAAGVSRNTVYRWRQEDFEFAETWYEAHENAVDVVENVIYQLAAIRSRLKPGLSVYLTSLSKLIKR